MKEKYVSTRGGVNNISASEGIVRGIASDGGLFVPSFIHDLKLDLTQMKDMTYGEMASAIFKLFLDDFDTEQIETCIHNAYYTGKFEESEPVCVKQADDRWFLELYHGPTCAFKDMALTILPHFMTTAMKNCSLDKEVVILTATSGDTGKAALAGFANVDGISIVVYYPKDGVSTIQEKQMLTQEGANTCVIGVHGNFDDTQSGVKAILNDPDLTQALSDKGYVFSSANSINIGRLLPQVVYYVYSYLQLVNEGAVALGDPVNFVVPTGNFGNILAGYYAKILGLPVGKLICASNSNNVLTDFFATGEYNRNRDFYKTISPSMDILISSNLERLLYELADGDTTVIADLMQSLKDKGTYTLPETLRSHPDASLFYGGYATEAETAAAIRNFFNEAHYLMDPHTAVANKVYDDYRAATGDTTPSIILSTASPYKFGHSVYESIYGTVPEGTDDYAVLNLLSEKTGTAIPSPLKDLDKKPNQHQRVCTTSDMADCITDFLTQKGEK